MVIPDKPLPGKGENSPISKGPKPIGLHVFACAVIFLGLNKLLYEVAQLSRGNPDWILSIAILTQGVIFVTWGIGAFMKRRGFYLLGLFVIGVMSINLLVNTVGMFIRLGAPQISIGLVWFIPIIWALYDYFRSDRGQNLLLRRFGVIEASDEKVRMANLFSPFNITAILVLSISLLIERIVLQ